MQPQTYAEMSQIEDSHFWFHGKRAFIKAALDRLPGQKYAILDVGAGTGGTTSFLAHWGSVTGLERKSQAIQLARKRNIHIKKGHANHLPFSNEIFDIVTYFDVLYHKGIDESKALKEALRVLTPGGHILITDCAIPRLWSQHDVVMDAKYRYTKKRLVQLVQNEGFIINTAQYIYVSTIVLFIASRLFSRRQSITRPPSGINLLLTLLLQTEARIPNWIPKPIGSSIMILAQKPMI